MGAWIIRLCVSALLLALIFTLVPFADVWAAARQISPLLWLGAIGLFLAGHAAAAAKWRLLIGGGMSTLIKGLPGQDLQCTRENGRRKGGRRFLDFQHSCRYSGLSIWGPVYGDLLE